MALTKVTNDLQDALAAAQPTITSVGTLTNFTSTGIDDNATSNAITITSDEKVGIGVAATDGTLHVHTATAGTVSASSQADDLVVENSAEGGMTIITPDDQSARIRFTSPSTNNDVGGASIFYRQNINKMSIGTEVSGGIVAIKSGAGNEAINLDASGNVGIGVVPEAWHANWTALQIGDTGFVGSYTAGATDITGLGCNVWSDGTYKYIETDEAVIYKQQNGTHIFDVAPSGTADAAISWTTAMTIANDGKIVIGNNIPMWSGEYGGALFLKGNNSTADRNAQLAIVDSTGAIAHNGVFINNNGAVLMKNTTSDNVDTGYGSRQDMDGSNYCTIALNNGTHYVRADTAWKFYVMGNGQIHSTSQSISGISDVRLKENITDIDTGLAEIMALQPRRFDWKDGGGTVLAGFVAQEVESVLPDLIGNFKHDDFEDAKSLRMGDILPTLVKAMQEQQAIIESLTARLEALEGE